MLKIADQVFEIESSNFSAHISIGEDGWDVSWSIEFRAKGKEVNGIEWEPHINPHSFAISIYNLRALSHSQIKLEDYDDNEEPMFLLYVLEHEAMRDVQLTFDEWKCNTVGFKLTGFADIYANEPYVSDLPIEVSMALPFDGVSVDEGKIEKAIEKFSQFFDIKDFGPPESRGVSFGFIFRPICI